MPTDSPALSSFNFDSGFLQSLGGSINRKNLFFSDYINDLKFMLYEKIWLSSNKMALNQLYLLGKIMQTLIFQNAVGDICKLQLFERKLLLYRDKPSRPD